MTQTSRENLRTSLEEKGGLTARQLALAALLFFGTYSEATAAVQQLLNPEKPAPTDCPPTENAAGTGSEQGGDAASADEAPNAEPKNTAVEQALEAFACKAALDPSYGLYQDLSATDLAVFFSLLEQGIIPTQTELATAISEATMRARVIEKIEAPVDSSEANLVVPNWDGVSFFDANPTVETPPGQAHTLAVIEFSGQLWVIMLNQAMFSNMSPLSDGTPFREALEQAFNDALGSFAQAATFHGKAFDANPQNPLVGNLIVLGNQLDPNNPPVIGRVTPHSVRDTDPAENPPGKIQEAIPSSMVIDARAFNQALLQLTAELDAIFAKQTTQMTPDEFVLYLKIGLRSLLAHELSHNLQFFSKDIVAYTDAEGRVNYRDRILPELMATLVEFFALLKSIDESGAMAQDIMGHKDTAFMTLWIRYILALVDCTEACNHAYPTEHTPDALGYSYAALLLEAMMETAGGDYNSYEHFDRLLGILLLSFHYNTVSLSLIDGNPYSEYITDHTLEQLRRMFPDLDLDSDDARGYTAEILYQLAKYSAVRKTLVESGADPSAAAVEALDEFKKLSDSELLMLISSSVVNDEDGHSLLLNLIENLSISSGTDAVLQGVMNNGQAKIYEVQTYATIETNSEDFSTFVGRNNRVVKLKDGDLLVPDDLLIIIAKKTSATIPNSNPPQREIQTMATVTGVTLGYRQFLPSVGGNLVAASAIQGDHTAGAKEAPLLDMSNSRDLLENAANALKAAKKQTEQSR